MNFSLSPCNLRTLLIFAGGYLLGSGEMAITDLETILGAAFPAVAAVWKVMETRKAAAAEDLS